MTGIDFTAVDWDYITTSLQAWINTASYWDWVF